MGDSAEDLRNWRGLYKAALFETDTTKLPWRIEEGRKALIVRSREPFKTFLNYDGETEVIEECCDVGARLRFLNWSWSGQNAFPPQCVSFLKITPPRQRYHGFVVFLE